MTEKNRFGLSKPVVTTSGGDEPEQRFYIISDGSRGGSGKRADNGTRVKSVDKIGYFQIARAKILTPLRDAVRLVDRDHGYVEITAYFEKAGAQSRSGAT